jgi:hypothetical protein
MKSGQGYSGNMFVGSKFNETRELGIVPLSKLIKADIKKEFPNIKFSLKTQRYSGGQSIDITITEIGFNPFSTNYKKHIISNAERYDSFYNTRFNEKYNMFMNRIREIVNMYNYDDSMPQADYFNKRFYSNVSVDEHTIILMYYPNHKESKLLEERLSAYKKPKPTEEEKKAAKEATRLRKEFTKGFKKGDSVVYIHDRDTLYVSKGVYDAKINKILNKNAGIVIGIEVDGKNFNRNVTLTLKNADNLKASRGDIRKDKITSILND